MTRQDKRPGESIDSLLRKFKRKVRTDGTLQELRGREHFEKPSEKKKRTQKAAERRTYLQQKSDKL